MHPCNPCPQQPGHGLGDTARCVLMSWEWKCHPRACWFFLWEEKAGTVTASTQAVQSVAAPVPHPFPCSLPGARCPKWQLCPAGGSCALFQTWCQTCFPGSFQTPRTHWLRCPGSSPRWRQSNSPSHPPHSSSGGVWCLGREREGVNAGPQKERATVEQASGLSCANPLLTASCFGQIETSASWGQALDGKE